MRRTRVALLLTPLILFAFLRVAATWRVYPPTLDEPAHIAAGMEWRDRGVYRSEERYPPLAPVAVALGPWLDGLHAEGQADSRREGNAILTQRGDQPRALALARAGVLPFLLLAIVAVFAWARSLAGDAAGLLAVLAFTMLPPVLAHAGLATSDAAAMGTIALALYVILRWLEAPTLRRTLGVGLAVGLALLAQVSALIYLPAALVVMLLAWRSAGNPVSPYVGGAAVAAVVTLLVVWAGYRFSLGPIIEGRPGTAPHAPRAERPGSLEGEMAALLRLPVFPAPGYARAVMDLRRDGRWALSPRALGVKTPLPFLLLALVGAAALLVAARQRRSALVPPLGALAMLLAAMTAKNAIGVRQVLPIYPLLAVCAGVGILTLWNRRLRGRLWPAGPILAAGLTGWLLIESLRAHPDSLAWVNQLAGRRPDRVLLAAASLFRLYPLD